MKREQITFDAILDLWPSLADLARDISEAPETVRMWKYREHIPPKHWGPILRAATSRGIEISFDDLEAARMASDLIRAA